MSQLKWLSQNAKMKKSSSHIEIFNWGIPAFMSQTGIKTCPNAGRCAAGCYAKSGTYRFKNVASKYEARLQLALSPQFETVMASEIETAIKIASKRGKEQCLIRIHDSGDFFSEQYTESWFNLIRQFPQCKFYAYTKQVAQFKALKDIPANLILIYSYSGKQDNLIDPKRDRHSLVFQDEKSLIESGYADASHNDLVAIGDNHRIGLVYHGSKNYANTKWGDVSK